MIVDEEEKEGDKEMDEKEDSKAKTAETKNNITQRKKHLNKNKKQTDHDVVFLFPLLIIWLLILIDCWCNKKLIISLHTGLRDITFPVK